MIKNLPEGWKKDKLGNHIREVSQQNGGHTGVPVLSVTNTQGFVRSEDYFERRVYSKSLAHYKIVQRGQFAYNPSRLNVGSLALLEEFEKGLLSPMYVVFEVLHGVDKGFLSYWLTSGHAKNLIKASIQGTVRDSVNYSALASFMIDLPPVHEQHKIAAILSSVDGAIEKTRSVIDQTKIVKKEIMQELLTRGVPGRHKKFRETVIGDIPVAWAVAKVGDAGRVQLGRQRAPKYQSGKCTKPYLRVANVFDGHIDFSDVLMMDFNETDAEQYRLQSGDILLNEGQSRELVGRCAIYAEGPSDCCFQNTLIRFQVYNGLAPDFAFLYFQYCFYSGKFAEISKQTTSVAHLGASRFATMNMPIPGYDEQLEIAGLINMVQRSYETSDSYLQQLTKTKSALMQILLTGQVRVIP